MALTPMARFGSVIRNPAEVRHEAAINQRTALPLRQSPQQ
jgi:hypothetical protein